MFNVNETTGINIYRSPSNLAKLQHTQSKAKDARFAGLPAETSTRSTVDGDHRVRDLEAQLADAGMRAKKLRTKTNRATEEMVGHIKAACTAFAINTAQQTRDVAELQASEDRAQHDLRAAKIELRKVTLPPWKWRHIGHQLYGLPKDDDDKDSCPWTWQKFMSNNEFQRAEAKEAYHQAY